MLTRNTRRFGQAGSRAAALNAALRRGLILTVVLCIVGAAVGALVGQRMSTVLVANATILVNPLDGNPFSTKGSGDDLENLETEAQLIQSNDVARMVQKREGKPTPIPDILAGLEVNVPPNTQILEIDYSSRASAVSLSRAQWFAEEYLAYREGRAKGLVASQTKRLEEQIAERRKEQSALAKELSRADPGSTQAGVLRVQLEAVSTQINQVRARSAELQAVSSNPGQIITPAIIRPVGLLGSWIAYSLAGLIGGLIIAVFIALIRSRADNRVRHVDDVATAGQVLLGEISTSDAVEAQMIFQGAGTAGQLPSTFRDLRVSLLTTEHRRPGVIVVTTARHDDEPPSSIAGLALATATANLRTVVVEAMASNLTRKGSGHADLADVLSGRITVDNALVNVRPHLDVLIGDDSLSLDDLFMAPEMHTLVDSLRDRADIVFIVTSNVHDARSKALIDVGDSVMLEVVQGASSYRDLYQASNDDTLIGNKLLGVVYVSRSRSSGRRTAEPSPKRSDMPVWENEDQASERRTTSAESQPADVGMVRRAPDSELGSEGGEVTAVNHVAKRAPDSELGSEGGEVTAVNHVAKRAPDSELGSEGGEITPVNLAPADVIKSEDAIYDLPPWWNGAVGGIAPDAQSPSAVRDSNLAAHRSTRG